MTAFEEVVVPGFPALVGLPALAGVVLPPALAEVLLPDAAQKYGLAQYIAVATGILWYAGRRRVQG